MRTKVRGSVVAAAVAFALLGVSGALAQDDLTPETGATTAAQPVEQREEGFDDWGLLGLLGLAGLAGLRRQPHHTVVEERTVGTTTRRP